MIKVKNLMLCILSIYSSGLFGVQNFSLNDRDTVSVKLSSKELTRIVVEGGRIDKLWGISSSFMIKEDKDKGEIFLRPKSNSPKVVSFFIRDDSGNTYTLLATKFDIPSQTVVLNPVIKKNKLEKFKNMTLVKRVKSLVRAMDLNIIENYSVKSVGKKTQLWEETEIFLINSYEQNSLIGDKYVVKNTDNKKMVLEEKEFLALGKNIIAVSLKKHNLGPNESTYLYVIRRN